MGPDAALDTYLLLLILLGVFAWLRARWHDGE